MKIAVLTYPVKHRKTFDTLSLLRANGYADVWVCAVPFHYQKKVFPIYQHRPEMDFYIPDLQKMSANFGYVYKTGEIDTFEIERDRLVLIAGAGILNENFITEHVVINSHPGYIPDCRGLDSLKWAIVEDKPIGVTTHIIGDYIDAGLIIERRQIDVYNSDSFHALAQRVYENEVSMLVEALNKYDSKELQMIKPDNTELHKRMPPDIEKDLLSAFDIYKEKHSTEREEKYQ